MNLRPDMETIVRLVPAGTTVLDLGCGDGALLAALIERKQVRARGVEKNEANVRACVARGLSVRHGDIEEGLADFVDGQFDFVILSQTLAYLHEPLLVLREALRVGRHAVVSFENAGYWRTRWRCLTRGTIGPSLDSGRPPCRLVTPAQFGVALSALSLEVVQSVFLAGQRAIKVWPALKADTAVYLITPTARSGKGAAERTNYARDK